MSKTSEMECSATSPIYLDYNATTPLAPEVIKSIEDSLHNAWGNPSSSHSTGKFICCFIETIP